MQLDLFTKYQLQTKSNITERGELMKELLETINQTRTGTFKPISMARMGMILQGIPTDALYALLSKCKDSGNRAPHYATGFSKRFWFEIKPQK